MSKVLVLGPEDDVAALSGVGWTPCVTDDAEAVAEELDAVLRQPEVNLVLVTEGGAALNPEVVAMAQRSRRVPVLILPTVPTEQSAVYHELARLIERAVGVDVFGRV